LPGTPTPGFITGDRGTLHRLHLPLPEKHYRRCLRRPVTYIITRSRFNFPENAVSLCPLREH
jgi:hypothetical protein